MTTKLKLFSRASLFAETGFSGVVMGLGWWEWGLGSWVCGGGGGGGGGGEGVSERREGAGGAAIVCQRQVLISDFIPKGTVGRRRAHTINYS